MFDFQFKKKQTDESSTSNRIDFEDHLVNLCQSLASKQWHSSFENDASIFPWAKSDNVKGMSLLHLAATLGYSRLVSTLLLWRSENPNVFLDTEINALSQDNEGFTPLVSEFDPIKKKNNLIFSVELEIEKYSDIRFQQNLR